MCIVNLLLFAVSCFVLCKDCSGNNVTALPTKSVRFCNQLTVNKKEYFFYLTFYKQN